MDDSFNPPLQRGSVKCPHWQWHPIRHIHTEGTAYTVQMMYFVCRGGRYYAGNEGTTSRHETRSPTGPARLGKLELEPAVGLEPTTC